MRAAGRLLGKPGLRSTGKKGLALLRAHRIGGGELGADGRTPAGITAEGQSNFTRSQVRRKTSQLRQAGYGSNEIRSLFDAGLAGGPRHELAQGNFGAMSVLDQLLSHPRGNEALQTLEREGIRGAEIWLLYKDEHGENIDKTVASLTDGSWRAKLNRNHYSAFHDRGDQPASHSTGPADNAIHIIALGPNDLLNQPASTPRRTEVSNPAPPRDAAEQARSETSGSRSLANKTRKPKKR